MKGAGGRSADKGEGWLDRSTRWREASIMGRLLCAWAPHSMKTTGRGPCATCRITASVNSSQPRPAWLAGCPSSTVRQVLSNNTPCCAQRTRLPPGDGNAGNGVPRSRCSSLKILRSDGGKGTPGATEKAKPSAWPRPWYGSCPSMTTRTASGGVSRSARSGWGGNTVAPSCSRCCRKFSNCTPAGAVKNPFTSACHPSATGQSAGSAEPSWSATGRSAASINSDMTSSNGPSGKQVRQRLAGVLGPHEGLANQERMHLSLAHALHIGRPQNARLCHQQTICRHIRQHAQRGVQADLKGAQIAVVDAHQRGLEAQGALQLGAVVHFDQHRHVQTAGHSLQIGHLGIVQAGGNQQDAVGAHHPGFVDLVGIDHEILAQHRQSTGSPGLLEVVHAALEKLLVR